MPPVPHWPNPLDEDGRFYPVPPTPVPDETPWTGEDESTQQFYYFNKNLAKDSYALAVDHVGGHSGGITSVDFDGGTVEEDELVGRIILINGVEATVTENTASAITFEETDFGTVADDAAINPGEIQPAKKELLVPFPYGKDIYTYFLMMMVDQMNGEIEKYNQSSKLFNNALLNYRNYVNRQRPPTRTGATARIWW